MNQKTCHTLAMAGLILGGISVIFGGFLFDIVGFVCSILAFRNSKKFLAEHPMDPYSLNTFKLAKIALVVCCVLGVANVMTAAILLPSMMSGTSVSGPMF